MNERIQILADEAFKGLGTNPVYATAMIYASKELEKFAELMAQEAADVAYNTYWNNPDKVRGAHLKQAIKQHFGVEE